MLAEAEMARTLHFQMPNDQLHDGMRALQAFWVTPDKKKGIRLNSRAQQFEPGDFNRFDLVLAMDQHNLETLQFMCSPETAQNKLRLFRSFDPHARGPEDVPDPYYGGDSGFEHVFDIVHRTCPKILDHVKSQLA